MNKKMQFFLVCFLTVFLTNMAFGAANLTYLVKQVQPAVITIITYDRNKKVVCQASGFFVDENGHIITNYHVLKGAYDAEIKTYSGKKYPITSVVAYSETFDLIKLFVNIPGESIRFVQMTQTPPEVAESILIVGSPMGLEHTVSEGIVSAVRGVPEIGKIFQISAPISPGSSGSPVVDMKGMVIGIATFQVIEGQNLNFAVPSEYIEVLKRVKESCTISQWINIISLEKEKIADALYEKEKYQKALLFYKEAAEINPGFRSNWHKLAHCYTKLNKRDKAIEAYEQAIRHNPDRFMIFTSYGLLGSTFFADRRYTEAINAYQQGILTMDKKTNNSISGALFYQKIGEAYWWLAAMEWGKASKAIEQGSDSPKTDMNKYFSKAAEAYKEAIRRNPDSDYLHSKIGDCYLSVKRYREAKEAFIQAISINPDNIDAHYSMGRIYLREKNKAAALDQYKILKNLDSERSEFLANLLFESIFTEKLQN